MVRVTTMRQLSRLESIVFLVGSVLMLVGSGAYVFAYKWAPWVYATGSLCFVAMQLRQRYYGSSTTIRRLRRIVFVSDVLFLLTAVLMFANEDNLFGFNIFFYLRYVYNNWVIVLMLAAILQLYTTHRISNELEEEAKKI